MNQKQIGIILICIGLLISLLAYGVKAKEDYYIDQLTMRLNNTCILEDGYCLHDDRNWSYYIISWLIGGALMILGAYLVFFDQTYRLLARQQEEFTKEVKEAKEKDTFHAYLAGFTPDEQQIIKAIHEQEGIRQSTLRFRTGLSKSMLSLVISSLEKRDVVTKTHAGKTNALYLRKKF